MEDVGRRGSNTPARILTVDGERSDARSDVLATEEPLEIRLAVAGETRTVAVTMRTPGNDFELAAGFLFGEGILSSSRDLAGISYCVDRSIDEQQRYNIVNVTLAPGVVPDLRGLDRHFFTSSACGVCGKASIDALELRGQRPGDDMRVARATLFELPARLRADQGVFDTTGGLHAAALFDAGGGLIGLREDVGRHNALDKLVGWALIERRLPLQQHILVVSGRVSFELMQKALAAGVAIVCGISAPSSLAVDVAHAFGMTLVGFLRERRFNVYSGEHRITGLRPENLAPGAKARERAGR